MLSAILITEENCENFKVELNHAHPSLNGYKPFYWIGYYLIVEESGPSLMIGWKFEQQYEFVIDKTKFNPIIAKS